MAWRKIVCLLWIAGLFGCSASGAGMDLSQDGAGQTQAECRDDIAETFGVEVSDLEICMGQALNVAPMNLDEAVAGDLDAAESGQPTSLDRAVAGCVAEFGEAAVAALLTCWQWDPEDIAGILAGAKRAADQANRFQLSLVRNLAPEAAVFAIDYQNQHLLPLEPSQVGALSPNTVAVGIDGHWITIDWKQALGYVVTTGIFAAGVFEALQWFAQLKAAVESLALGVSTVGPEVVLRIVLVIPKPVLVELCAAIDPWSQTPTCQGLGFENPSQI